MQRNKVTRRHRGVAANDNDAAEEIFDLRCSFGVDSSLARDAAAEEPARSVDTNETGETHLAGLRPCGHRDLSEDLGAKGSVGDSRLTALLVDLFDDLGTNLVPQPAATGCGKRRDLKAGARVVETNRDDALAALFDLEAQLQVGTGDDLDAAEVDVGPDRVGLRLVEGSVDVAVLWGRLGVQVGSGLLGFGAFRVGALGVGATRLGQIGRASCRERVLTDV